MGRRGISLSAYAERKWAKYTLSQATKLLLVWLISATSAYWLSSYAEQAKETYAQQNTQISQLNEQQLQLEIRLAQWQNQQSRKSPLSHLNAFHIRTVLAQLRQLPIQGGLEEALLNVGQTALLRLKGEFTEPEQFITLENYLKKQKLHYQPLYFHTNENRQLEFELLISLTSEESP